MASQEEIEQIIKIRIDAADSATSIKDLRQNIKDLQNTALEIGEGGKGFDELIAKAGELKDKLNDTRASTEALAGNIGENLTKSFAKVASAGIGAFEAIEGAQAVFGAKSEDLEKTLVKLQGLLALSNGIKEVSEIGKAYNNFKIVITDVIAKIIAYTTVQEASTVATEEQVVATETQATATVEATAAQEGLNAAMLANPVILVIAAIAALVVGISAFNDVSEKAVKEQQKFNEELEKSEANLNSLRATYDKVYIDIAETIGNISKDRAQDLKEDINYNQTKADLITKYDTLRRKSRDDEKVSEEEFQKIIVQLQEDFNNELEELDKIHQANKKLNKAKADEEQIALERKAISELKNLQISAIQDEETQAKAAEDERHREAVENDKITYKDSANLSAILLAEDNLYWANKKAITEKYAQQEADIRAKYQKINADNLKAADERLLQEQRDQAKAEQDQLNRSQATLQASRKSDNDLIISDSRSTFEQRSKALEANYKDEIVEAKRQADAIGLTEEEKNAKLNIITNNYIKDVNALSDKQSADLKAKADKDAKTVEDAEKKKRASYLETLGTLSKFVAAIGQVISGVQEAIDQNYANSLQKLDNESKARQDALQLQYETQLVNIEDAKTKEDEILYNSNQAQLADASLTADQKDAINKQYALKKYNLDKKTALAEYNTKKEAADAEYKQQLAAFKASEAIKKSQFESDKKFRLAQAVVSGAQAVLSALAVPPYPVGVALAASAAIVTAFQIATISKQQYNAGTAPSPPPPIALPSFSAPPDSGSNSSSSATKPSDIALFGTAGRRNKLSSDDDGSGNRSINVNVNLDVNEVTKKQTSVANFEKGSTLGH